MWWNRKPEHRELLAFGLPTGHLHSRDLGQTLQTRVSACFLLEVHFGHVYFQVPVCLGSRVCLVLVACQWYGLACFPCVFSELVGSWPECWWVWGALVGHACSWLVCFWGAKYWCLLSTFLWGMRLLTGGESVCMWCLVHPVEYILNYFYISLVYNLQAIHNFPRFLHWRREWD